MLEVVDWVEWSDDDWKPSEIEFDKAREAVIKEIRKHGYHFDGYYHQNGDYGVPLLSDGHYFEVSQRVWGGIMADAYPEEYEDPNDRSNYVRWYLAGWGQPGSSRCWEEWRVPYENRPVNRMD